MNLIRNCYIKIIAPICVLLIVSFSPAFAEPSKPGALDGATVYALENYLQKGNNQVMLGYSLYPLDPYFNAYDINTMYSYFFDAKYGWELFRLHYIFTSNTDLTRQLADKYAVNPKLIDRLKAVFSSSFLYTFSYGKQIILEDYITYHRLIAILGFGQMNTLLSSSYAGIVGVRGDFAINERFSWLLESRYHIAFKKTQDNTLSFIIGTGLNF